MLLRIESASVNRGDLFRRDGSYGGGSSHSLPMIIGWDVAGTIIRRRQRGPESREVGQRVVATLPQGGYAEMVAVNEAGTVLDPRWRLLLTRPPAYPSSS